MASLTVQTHDRPTIFNKEMAIGTLLVPFGGTLIGGLIGKRRMERENHLGKEISDDPSFWNKDTLLGALIGSHAGRLLAAAAIIAIELATDAMPAASTAILLTIEGSLAGMAAGGYLGGEYGQYAGKKEFAEAVAQQKSASQDIGRSHAMEPSLAQEKGRADGKSWSQAFDEEALLASALRR